MRDLRKAEKIRRKSDYLIKAALSCIRERGFLVTAKKALNYLATITGIGDSISYSKWAKRPLFTDEQLDAQRRQIFDRKILFSIITPLFNTDEGFLRDMIESVCAQTYSDWELCLADGSDTNHEYVKNICLDFSLRDGRIKYKKLEKNLGIAGNSNACIDMTSGEYICILDQDDILHPAALHEVMTTVYRTGADLIYTDEATFTSPDLTDIPLINFKPNYAPDNLRAINYICHFVSFRHSLIDECGAFREEYDGSQDHELILRLTSNARRIEHVPEVLYYWRTHCESTAESGGNKAYAYETGIRAVKDNLEDAGLSVVVESVEDCATVYKVTYELNRPLPKVSIIIPNCDHAEDLKNCVDSIINKSTYENYEIVIVENNSVDVGTFTYYNELTTSHGDRIKIITWPEKNFNWAAINNYAVREVASGDYLLLLNNDTEVITAKWIEELLMHAQRPEVGITGAMLYYPNDTIQHAGIIVGLGGVAGHVFRGEKRGARGYMRRLQYTQNMSAVTGACMMIRRTIFDEVGGIDECFAIGLNDIDFCMRVRRAGYLIVWNPNAELYHFESKSHWQSDRTVEGKKVLNSEISLFKERWAKELAEGDPYYNPNLSYKRSFGLEKWKEPRYVSAEKGK